MFRKLECTGRAHEYGSDVELVAGTVDTTGLIRRASLDVGMSNTDRQIVFGIPPHVLHITRTLIEIRLDQQKPIPWVSVRITLMETQEILPTN